MISWRTSVAPPTASTFSSSAFESGGGQGVVNTVPYTATASGTISANWSITTSSSRGIEGGGESGQTVLGTTNSIVSGTSFTNSTRLSTERISTSTTSTATSTSRATTTASFASTRPTSTTQTSSNSRTYTTSSFVTTTSNRLTRTTASATITRDATTTSGSQLVAGLYATVWKAESSEVLCTANASALGDIRLQAASDAGGTESQFTVQPFTETVAFAVVDKGDTSTTRTISAASSGGSTTFQRTTQGTSEAISIEFGHLPMKTLATQTQTIGTQVSNFTSTVFSSFSRTISWEPHTITQFGRSWTKTKTSFFGVEFDLTTTISASRTAETANNSFVTSSSSSLTLPGQTAITSTVAGVFPSTTQVTGEQVGLPYSESNDEVRGSTGLAENTAYWGSTKIASFPFRRVEGFAGVTNDGALARFYAANGLDQTYLADAYALVARSVSSAMPGREFVLETSSGDTDNPDYSTVGTAILSGLSGSATTTTTGSSNTSSSFTFELQPQGSAVRYTGPTNSLLFHANLGPSQTVYHSIGSGVFADTDGSTFSTSLHVSSFSGSDSRCQFLRPLTFIEPGPTTNSVLVWSAPRNSTALP